MSNRILEAGYMIDSLLTKYETIHFFESQHRRCNGNSNPYKNIGLDGTSLEPYEVVFVKNNDREATTDTQHRAQLYQTWIEDINKTNILVVIYSNRKNSHSLYFSEQISELGQQFHRYAF